MDNVKVQLGVILSTCGDEPLGASKALLSIKLKCGKTLLARALPGILPEMSIDESRDVTRIYSVADQLPTGMPLIRYRPFRAPHHTIYMRVWWVEANLEIR